MANPTRGPFGTALGTFGSVTHLALIASVLMLGVSRAHAEQLKLTMYGAFTSVPPALDQLHVGDSFEFGFSLDTANLLSIRPIGTRYLGGDLYFKVDGRAAVTSTTQFGELDFLFDSGAGPTGQGFNFEKNNMSAFKVNGYSLTDTYIDIGFNHPFSSETIGAAEILSLNDQPVVGQNSSLSFDHSPYYKYVQFDINRVVVVPEPGHALLTILLAALASRRASSRRARLAH